MLLTSPVFFIFLSLTLFCYYLFPPKHRWIILLLSSYFFCFTQNYHSLLIISFITIINYYFGLKIEDQQDKQSKNRWFILSICLNILLLFYFKYIAFSSENTLTSFSRATTKMNDIFIIAGISYYFLQAISYQNDIRLQLIKPQNHIGKFAIYFSFFPKLLAGPIETPSDFFNQIKKIKKFNPYSFSYGIQRIVIGLFKKLVLADRLNIIVNNVFEVSETASGLSILVAIYLFTIQLYFDLSGYADMAIGIANLFGIQLSENFKLPFLATSITKFWRKWHISLVNWLTNHLFLPLVYYFRSNKQNAVIIGIGGTFILSGIWHGLGLNFIIWGVLFSSYMIFELILKKQLTYIINLFPKVLITPLLIITTFNIVSITNLLIRYSEVADIKYILSRIINFNEFIPSNIYWDFIWQLSKKGELEFTFYTLSTLALTFGYLILENMKNKLVFQKNNYTLVFVLLILLVLFGLFTNKDQFIYIIY